MAKVRVIHDPEGDTLVVWFGDPLQEEASEMTDDDVILMKDREGRVIGFEKLNFSRSDTRPLEVAFETIVR